MFDIIPSGDGALTFIFLSLYALKTGFRLLESLRGTVKSCSKSVAISLTCLERFPTLQENKCVR